MRYWLNWSCLHPKPKWGPIIQFWAFFGPFSLVCAPLLGSKVSDFCLVRAVVPVCALLTMAACLPPGSPVCQRWLLQSRLWEQPVSLPRSPAPLPEGQRSIPHPRPFLWTHIHIITNTQMPEQTRTHTKTLQCSHPFPIILGSNFISTRVAAHCRQPLQSFLINSRFVPHPSFWTHLSYIPISAALSTPRQPPFANPTASPLPAAPPQGALTVFFQPADHLLAE